MTLENFKAADIMSTNVIKAKASLPFTDACRLFFELGIHHLPIIDKDQQLVGMLSTNDTFQAFTRKVGFIDSFEDKSVNQQLSIEELMSQDPVTISESTNGKEIARIFTDLNLHALPVLNNGKLVGIVTSNDLLNHIAKNS